MRKYIFMPLFLFVIGCSGSNVKDSCEPGRQLECSCAGGVTGYQTCKDDGSGWGDCVCPCVKDCTGLECGEDPLCGESCGTCGANSTCNTSGICECDFVDCEGSCCDDGQVCADSACCTPDCGERECGPEPVCGTICGDCGAGEECTMSGECSSGCTPDCGTMVCGPDPVCQLSCGDCPVNTYCTTDGQCISGCVVDCSGRECGPDQNCDVICGYCGPDESCTDDGICVQCTPDCTGRECGDNGCGGTCAPGCGDFSTCSDDGLCVCDNLACGDSCCAPDEVCRNDECVTIECNCNFACDRDLGEICDSGVHQCVIGAPPVNCQDDCDCYQGESCVSGVCEQTGVHHCTIDEECGQDEKCIYNCCVPKSCTTRDDCANAICLVCKEGECTTPPGMCQGDDDCCVGFHCNFGTCIPDSQGCLSDDDCKDPDYPRCREGECMPECVNDADCAGNQECRDNECVSPGCTIETCPQGQWCNPTAGPAGVGECQEGCDQNSDCAAGKQCNYESHVCIDDCCGGCLADQYCDTNDCVCKTRCQTDQDCQQDWECDQASGQCHPAGAGQEGAPCTVDLECDNSQGLLCDDCDICSNPPESQTCLYDCAGTYQCPRTDLSCLPRGFSGGSLRLLCIPQ